MKVVKLEDCINEIKSLDNYGLITRTTDHICECMRTELEEFEAVPLDRIKRAREELHELLIERINIYDEGRKVGSFDCVHFDEVVEIIDNLIAEVEE